MSKEISAQGLDLASDEARSKSRTGDGPPDWVVRLARFGYVAKGIVYALVGYLAAQAAFDAGSAEGSEGALASLIHEPFGRVMVGIIAAGLAGYVAWRVAQTIVDPEDQGTDGKGLVMRGYYLVSAISYSALVVFAVRLILGSSDSGGGSTSSRTAELMSQPLGRWLVAIVGLAVLGTAGRQFYRAATESFKDRLAVADLTPTVETWLMRSARVGLSARGVVFGIIGGFLLVAAYRAEPGEARGLAGALQTLEQQPYGPWLLGVVAVGLIAYGIHQGVKARYRVIG